MWLITTKRYGSKGFYHQLSIPDVNSTKKIGKIFCFGHVIQPFVNDQAIAVSVLMNIAFWVTVDLFNKRQGVFHIIKWMSLFPGPFVRSKQMVFGFCRKIAVIARRFSVASQCVFTYDEAFFSANTSRRDVKTNVHDVQCINTTRVFLSIYQITGASKITVT